MPQTFTTAQRVEAPDVGVTLEAPPGWHVRDMHDPRALALVRDTERATPPAYVAEGLGVHRGQPGSLRDAAEATMRRYVAYGLPDGRHDRLFGRPALVVEWTDGANRIVTWFVDTTRHVLEVHVHVFPYDEVERCRRLAAELLPHLRVHD